MTRRAHDQYYTPAWQTRALLAHQEITGVVLEPCAGDGAIADVLIYEVGPPDPTGEVITNDVVFGLAQFYDDASKAALYDDPTMPAVDWVVTNPPYAMPLCRDIVRQAVKHARVGVAMLLRLSFLEPTVKTANGRGDWLAAHPPDRLIVLPRYSYTQDGHSDSITTAWMIWLKQFSQLSNPSPIICLPRADVTYADRSTQRDGG